MKQIEIKSIIVKGFKDDTGNPVCALSVPEGHFCKFLRTCRGGFAYICSLDVEEEIYITKEEYLKPHKNCLVWAKGD